MPLLSHDTILAIGAVVDIALHSGAEPVRSGDVADRLQLSRRCLEPVLQPLVRKGILQGVRGANGGYKLGKARDALSVYDISKAIRDTEERSKGIPWVFGGVVVPTLVPREQFVWVNLKRSTLE